MQIEIGKTYITRNGETFTATGFTGKKGTYAVIGRDSKDRLTWRSLKGRFDRKPHDLDVIAVKN